MSAKDGKTIDLLKFVTPVHDKKKEEEFIASLSKQVQKKYKVGLVIGRFQPLHYGHVYLLKQALLIAESLVIGIGSTNVTNLDNPFSADVRKKMLSEMLNKEGFAKRVKKIIEVEDCPDDSEWLKDVLSKTGLIDVVIGNNDWVNGIFRDAGYKVIEIPLLEREIYQGKIIRKKLIEKGVLQ